MRGRTLMLIAAAAGFVTACEEDTIDPITPTATYTATLSGANERPNPVTTSATGTFNATLGANNILAYSVTWSGLTTTSNNAHIHGPILATSGNAALGVLIDFNNANA